MDGGLEQITRPSPPPRVALRTNPIQWKNLYHHRFGPCTYAPPLPRNPSTTTYEYPNTDAFLALQDAMSERPGKAIAHAFQGFSWGGDSGLPAGGTQRSRSNSNTSSSFAASPFEADEPFTGSQRASLVHRTSFLLQRKAQLILRKKREMEELRKQNPQELEACVLSVNQSAWTLIADDKIAQTSGIEAKEYAESARQMKDRLMAQFANYPQATPATSVFGGGGGGSATPPPVYERPFALDTDVGPPPHAIPSGSTNPMHQLLGIDAEHRAVLLAEMSPFFAVISPPTVVNHLHTITAFKPGICVAPVVGGAGDSVGLPIFSQFATWEEACTRRGQWACTPFHFMLTRDGSFNHGHAAAILLLLETLSTRMHRHNRLPEIREQAGLSPAEKPLPMLTSGPFKRGGLLSAPAAGARHGPQLTPQDEGLTGHTTPTPRAAEHWDGKKRFGCGKCLGLQNPNPCPLFALETAVEDLLVVYEHAGSRMALPMMRSVLRVFLDKALKPALSDQLFGKEALLDVYSPRVASTDGFPPNGEGGRGEGIGSGGGTASDEDSDKDDDSNQLADPVTGGASIFSEREFHSLFILARYFLDGPQSLSGEAPSGASAGGAAAARRPGGGRARGDGAFSQSGIGGQAGTSAASASAGGYVRIQATARAPTASLCEALVRYEEARRWQRRLSKLRVRQVLESYQNQASPTDLALNSAARVLSDPSTAALPHASNPSAGGNNNNRLPASETLRFEDIGGGEMRPPFMTTPPASRSPSVVALVSPAAATTGSAPPPLPRSPTPPPPSHVGPPGLAPPPLPPPTKEEVALLEAIRLEEAFPKSATRLGTALIALTGYLRLHGMGWSQGIFRSLLEHLKDPLVQLYVTDGHLPPPPTRQVTTASVPGRSRSSFIQGDESASQQQQQRSAGGGGRPSVSSSAAPARPSVNTARGGSFLRRLSDVAPRDDPLTRTGSLTSGSRTSSVALDTTVSPRTAVVDSQWTFPVEMTSSQTFESTAPSGKAGAVELFPTEGLEPAMVEFLTRMHAKERDIAVHIHRSLDMFLSALVNSHSEQKIPSGISYLVTTMCAIVHSHLLSGVVMASALHAEGIEPDSVDMVQHFVQALLGSVEPPPTQPSPPPQPSPSQPAPQQQKPKPPPPPAASTEQSEPSSPTASTTTTSRRRQTVFIDPPAAPSKPEPPKAAQHPPQPQELKPAANAADPGGPNAAAGATTSISLVNDIRTFRLAKFILFDCWLLPLLSNAQRFGLVPPHAAQHLLNNISAFVRYCKILVNSTYVQREEERKESEAKSGRKKKSSDPLDGLSLLSSKEMESAAWQALKSTTMPPYISGIYHAGHGTLVQLFRLPKQGGNGADADDDASSSRPDSSASGGLQRRGSRRKSGGGGGGSGALRRSSRSGSSSGGGFFSVVKRRASLSKLTSPRGGPTAARLATAEYFVPQDRGWPALGQLSPPLQQLNVHLGIVNQAALGSFVVSADGPYFDLGPDESNALQLVETFCWTTSTDDDHSRVVPEFQVSHDVAVRCCENLYHVVTGQHPATKCLQEVASANAGEIDTRRSSVMSTAPSADTRPTGGAKSAAERPGTGSNSSGGGRATLLPPSQECVNVFLRCLHSVLLHPTIAGAALDHLSVNHRRLFQHLLRATKMLSAEDDSTTLAQTLYPYLIVGVKDQPLVDVNALTVLLASGNSTTDAAAAPSAYIQAKRRLLSRQLFLSTGARGVAAAAAVADEVVEGGTQAKDSSSSAVNKTRKRSVSKERSAHPAEHLQSLFPAWWAYVAASLCVKAESVIHECSSTLARKWDKRCRATVRRHSHRDSHTEGGGGGGGAEGSKRQHKVSIDESAGGGVPSALLQLAVERPRPQLQLKRAVERVAQATVLSPKTPRKPAGDSSGGSGASREGTATPRQQQQQQSITSATRRGGATGAKVDGPDSNLLAVAQSGTRRSSSTTGSDLFKKRCNNPLMHRWRAAVTNLVSKGDDDDAASTSEYDRSFRH